MKSLLQSQVCCCYCRVGDTYEFTPGCRLHIDLEISALDLFENQLKPLIDLLTVADGEVQLNVCVICLKQRMV